MSGTSSQLQQLIRLREARVERERRALLQARAKERQCGLLLQQAETKLALLETYKMQCQLVWLETYGINQHFVLSLRQSCEHLDMVRSQVQEQQAQVQVCRSAHQAAQQAVALAFGSLQQAEFKLQALQHQLRQAQRIAAMAKQAREDDRMDELSLRLARI